MKILQVISKTDDGSPVLLIGANRGVLAITNSDVTQMLLPGGAEGDSSVSYVTNLVVAEGNKSLFATFDDKSVSKWDLVSNMYIGSSSLKKKPNAITCGQVQGQDIVIIGDKVGDIWGFQSQQMQTLGYLGGHPVTIITDVTISKTNTILASCDRDEKVKISSFPIVEEVLGYLLAHKSVVTSITFLDTEGKYLVSTGWDHKVILWNTQTFAPLDELSMKGDECVEPPTSSSSELAAAVNIEDPAVEEGEDGEDGEKERDYNEAKAGNYPFKLSASSNGLFAVLCKNEKKVTIVRAVTSGDNSGLEVVLSFITPAQPVDCAFMSGEHIAVVLPHPYYLRIYSTSAAGPQDATSSVLSERVISSLQTYLGETFNSSILLKSLGFEDDRNLTRDQLENPIRSFPKAGQLNKRARKC